MKKDINPILITRESTILSALKQMDDIHRKLLIVVDENKLFVSLLSIGDLQRAIINNKSLDTPIFTIVRKEVNVAHPEQSIECIKDYMKERRNDFMPIVNSNREIIDVIFWEEVNSETSVPIYEKFDLPVVIMAGGKGTRLLPLTNVLPKPLIPLGNQTMLEDIMDRFVDCGCHNFFISVNYKAETIKHYLNSKNNSKYNIHYFQEPKPLGTAGSLHLLNDIIKSTFFVSNCDIIIDNDYSEILDYHKQNHNEITVVAALKNYSIPYGTLETKENGMLQSIQEKPNLMFKINTGMYILEPHLINEIPQDEFYHITFLIEKLINEGRKVGVFPISEGSWVDVGNWEEYMKYIKG